jgi:hypothetical protein
MTPEGKVKVKIKKLLDLYGVYYFMPVQSGYGPAGLDFHCMTTYGDKSDLPVAFFIEAKAPGKKVISGSRQEELINKLRGYNAAVFVVSDEVTLAELEIWLRLTMLDKTEDSVDERARPTTEQGRGVPFPE